MKFFMKKSVRLIIFLLASALLVELDQITKIIARANLEGKSEGFSIIPGVLKLFYLENQGAAWGILNGKLNFFIVLTCFIVLVLVYIVIKMPADKKYNYLFFTIIFFISLSFIVVFYLILMKYYHSICHTNVTPKNK